MEGWISLHRKFLEWEWYDDNNTKSLFIHLLLKSNNKPKKWRGKNINRGQFFTSINHISNDLGLTIKQVRNSIDKLVLTGEIIHKGASDGSMITICKYDSYQDNKKKKGKQEASEGQAEGKRGATTNKDNKEINILFSEFWELYDKKRGDKEKIEIKWISLNDSERENIINYIPRYKVSQPDKKYRKDPSTFLNNKSWNDELINDNNNYDRLSSTGKPRLAR